MHEDTTGVASNLIALAALCVVPSGFVFLCFVVVASGADTPARGAQGRYQVPYYFQQDGDLRFDRNALGGSISLGGHGYSDGIGTRAHSEIRVTWRGHFATLSGACGIDDAARGRGSIVCKIASADRLLYESPVIRGGDSPVAFEVPVDGITGLLLIVEDADDGRESDLADWAALRLSEGR